VFTLLTAAFTGALWFVHPRPTDAMLGLVLVAAATVAYEIATVFYNSMLADVAPADRIGFVSGLAWGLGYVGGLVCLLLCLVLLINPDSALLRLDRESAAPVRACALLAAGWLLVFGWPVLVFVRGEVSSRRIRLGPMLRAAARDRRLLAFLLARMLYSDGLTTLFAFGGIYAAGQFAMGAQQVLLLGIALQLSAGVGALAFARIDDRIGDKVTILLCLGALAAISCLVLLTRSAGAFWPLALLLGIFIGPSQAASRSLMARMSPPREQSTHFGLYALSGRVTGFVGPASLGVVTAVAHSQRAGMAVIVVLLVAGALVLAPLRLGAGESVLTSG
jgi:UMF1 family MFS transporter